MINHVNDHVIERTKAEHTFLAVVHSVYGAIKVARNVRTDAIEVGSIG
jgi:hypothetical protein